jgi:hypothetical protein
VGRPGRETEASRAHEAHTAGSTGCSGSTPPRNRPACKTWRTTCRSESFIERILTHYGSASGQSANRSATCKAAENDCLERRISIRPCVPSHVAYKAERGGNEPFWSAWTMYPRSQERHRSREATVYLPALGGDGPRLGDHRVQLFVFPTGGWLIWRRSAVRARTDHAAQDA